MAVRVWRRRFRRCIRGHDISVVGCIRCATSWRKCGSQTMQKKRPECRPFIWRKGGAKPKPLFAASAPAGGGSTARWCDGWNRTYQELLSFFAFPRHLWRKLRTTNVIERCFVEVRRRTRPMVCFVNVESVDRIIYSIFQRFNLEWKTRTLNLFTQAA